MQLREYQTACIRSAVENVRQGKRVQLYAAPTGTGKSVIELEMQRELREEGYNTWIITPRVEIIRGMLQKLQHDTNVSLSKLVKTSLDKQITTPTRLVNLLRKGHFSELPDGLIVDEVHHATAATYEEIRLALAHCFLIGLTATPFRANPRGTAEFLATWGDPQWIITIKSAIERGYMSCPDFQIVPLVDDDQITVQNGEFVVKTLTNASLTRLDSIAELTKNNWGDVPTMVSLPSTELVQAMHEKLGSIGVSSVCVIQNTKDVDRQRAFDACLKCNAVLLQINVVSEGVDLPIRRLIDASPTMSPVRWMQQVGRITRPGGSSQYICTNRNMERHGYLWAGAVPPKALKDAVTAWGNMSARSLGNRAVGLEKIGKFRPVELPLAGGVTGAMYSFQVVSRTGAVHEYVAIVHPTSPHVFYAHRERGNAIDGYGSWEPIACIPDLDGATPRSSPSGRLSPKQADWWKRSALRHGLDPQAEVNSKVFQVLPVLANCNVRLV